VICNTVVLKDVGTVSSGTLDAVAMVYTAFSGFVVVKVLEIVVEIDAACTEISAEGRVSCKDGGDVNVMFVTKGNGKISLPFMKMHHDRKLKLSRNVLEKVIRQQTWPQSGRDDTNIAEEPRDEITKDDGFICFVVIWGTWDDIRRPLVC
jgi:hypothetical protein